MSRNPYPRKEETMEIVDKLNKLADSAVKPRDLFWARLDTLCQLTPAGVDRENRIMLLREEFPKWISIPFDEPLMEQFDRCLMGGIYYNQSRSMRAHVMLQIASLGAKLLWGDPRYANATWQDIYERCMDELRKGYEFDNLGRSGRVFVENELKAMLKRYTDSGRKCREMVYMFFRKHALAYENVLERLSYTLNEMSQRTRYHNTEEMKIEPPAAPEKVMDAVPEKKAEDIPAAPVSMQSGEFVQIMEKLKFMEKTLGRISRNMDEFDDDACGLCKFVERTASYMYNRPLSRLYDLYVNMPEQISAGELKVILDTFFHALRTLDIEAIDAQRLEKDYPEEYCEEIAGRGDKAYRFSLCGWSYKDSMVIAPQFEEEKQ